MRNLFDKLAGAIMLLILIIGYLYLIGGIISNQYDVTEWPLEGRVYWLILCAILGGGASIAFFNLKDEEK